MCIRDSPAPGYTARSDSRVADKVVNLNSGGQLKVVLVAPKQFELAAEIADHPVSYTHLDVYKRQPLG